MFRYEHTINFFVIQFSINSFRNYCQLQKRITVSVLIVLGIQMKIWTFRFPGYQNVTSAVLVLGPESVSYERSRPIDRCILREISARVFFEKIKKSRKIIFPIFPGYQENGNKLISNISRIREYRKSPFSNISRIIENIEDFNFQYFQARNN